MILLSCPKFFVLFLELQIEIQILHRFLNVVIFLLLLVSTVPGDGFSIAQIGLMVLYLNDEIIKLLNYLFSS
ncbi:Hypothetical protein F387_01172 [Wohlfahrtiimonas chitiniclastica SH04]|uniref:Uncharacterized protein n=1 Tax=Wohlfahrtiimonas chitiniclastica SH04 TaxID=1261130 RepID=L8Y0I1_9GAMM|nr:Hypothetical protein F387_01172 [Wohlfahrtiimonas chitiniclastica SH04]